MRDLKQRKVKKMNRQTVNIRLKRFLAEDTGASYSEVSVDSELREPPLRYSASGLRALAQPLNRLFSKPPMRRPLKRDETGRAATVRDLADRIVERY